MMDWEGARQRRNGREAHSRQRTEPRGSLESRRGGRPPYKGDFPNYLNPYRQTTPPTSSREDKVSRKDSARTDDKAAYYQKLREDIKDYRKYRNHQPFRRTEVPSIWKNAEGAEGKRPPQHKQATKAPAARSRESVESTKKVTSSKPRSRQAQASKRTGRNIDFSGIVSREPEISEQTFKQRYVTEDRDLPPYLKKEMNGENKRHEH